MLRDYAKNQIDHYRLHFPGQSPKFTIHYLKEGRTRLVRPGERKEVWDSLHRTFDRIRNKQFESRPKKSQCKLCPVHMVCNDGQVQLGN